MEVQWSEQVPSQQQRDVRGNCVESRYNRLYHFVWRNWTFDRWTSFPLHLYLSNRVVVGKWSRIHKVKKWPGSHTVDSSHLTPQASPGRWSHVLLVRPPRNGHPKDISTCWLRPSEILTAPSNSPQLPDNQLCFSTPYSAAWNRSTALDEWRSC